MAKDILVKDVMTEKVFTCPKSTTVKEAAGIMKANDAGSVIVCEGKRPVGIVTREDIANKLVAEGKNSENTTVKDIMSSEVVSVPPEETLSSAAKLMSKHGFRHLPVKYLDKLVGFVSLRNILGVSPGLLDLFSEHLESETGIETTGEDTTDGECELCGNYSDTLSNVNDKFVCDNCEDEAEGD